MNRRYDDYLCKRYPGIYRDRRADMRTTAMCWGFDIGDGWFTLLENLNNLIENITENARDRIISDYKLKNKIEWNKTLDDSVLKELRVDELGVIATQVKEKYGGLQFYYRANLPEPYSDEVEGAVAMASHMSQHICEICGDKGKINKSGRLQVRCFKHRED